ELSPADAARVKLFTTEVQGRVIDKCLQVHGGYGYILEYPIARLYTDARVTRIYGGTSEVMKTIIAKDMGLSARRDWQGESCASGTRNCNNGNMCRRDPGE